MGKLRPNAVHDPSRSHSEFVAGLPGPGAWGLTIIWSLQDQVPRGLCPTVLSTCHSDAAWAEMWGEDSQVTMTSVTAHTHSGSPG